MDTHGALVGWSHQDLGDKVLLRIETFNSPEAAHEHTPNAFRVLLTKQQASVLGTYLLEMAGQTPPRPGDRGLLKRMFG